MYPDCQGELSLVIFATAVKSCRTIDSFVDSSCSPSPPTRLLSHVRVRLINTQVEIRIIFEAHELKLANIGELQVGAESSRVEPVLS